MKESENCPAFEDGCPYSPGKDIMKNATEQCPAFLDGGCPFKEVKNQEELQSKMKEIPQSHLSQPFFQNTMEHVHQMNQKYTDLLGKPCPHFNQKCPFKVICEDGSPMVVLLERFTQHTVSPQIEEAVRLSKELKMGTKEAHTRAESTHFVTEFIKGNVSEEFYALYLTQLYFIYVALEERADECKDDIYFGKLHFPELHRQQSLERDLQFYLGYDWKQQLTMLEATKAYIECIKQSSPLLLIAHAYTRFLGDLSGGQILKKKAQRHYGLPGDSGTQFYQFNIPSHHEFKQKYRSTLDDLEISQKIASEIVKEANKSFDFNTDLFLELDQKLGLTPKPIVSKPQTPEGGCPFGFVANPGKKETKNGIQTTTSLLVIALAALVYLMWRTSA